MKLFRLCILVIIFSSLQLFAQQGFNSFNTQNDFLLTSPGALRFGLNGYDNPALLTYLEGPDLIFNWSDERGRWNEFNRWGLFGGIKNLGFGLVHARSSGFEVTDYKVSLAFGDRSFSLGAGFGWSGGDAGYFNRADIVTLGMLLRPSKYLSMGLTGTASTEFGTKEGYAELAARPLGNELITLFADLVFRNGNITRDKKELWSAGAAIEALPGLRITGRYFQTGSFSAGIQLSLGNIGFTSQAHFDDNQVHSYNTYGIRIGTYDRNPFSLLFPSKNYMNITLSDEVKYQRFIFFDNSNTLFDLISQINAAKVDPNIKGIAVNADQINIDREMLWELRDRLEDFKKSGKKVVVFIERPDMTGYYFSTVADKVVLDPLGMINMQGLISGRTFYKGTLDKIGVGFDELRFFRYKSAYESLAQDSMSQADREQRQKMVDEYYNFLKTGICGGRKLSPEKFDEIVDKSAILMAEEARDMGLVDTLARWENAGEIIKTMEGKDRALVSAASLEKYRLPDDNHWGEFDRIAIIYAVGTCAMDAGINARKLVKDVESAAENPGIKAIVLRVDYPGGDGMASDYIAEAIKKCRKVKPVIISQGSVAASGGYWLSMYGDTIVTAPNTITGSIGVIGAWVFNKGLSEKLGFTTDYVKKGEHAELGFGASIPLIGISLPDRALNNAERTRIEYTIKKSYDQFIAKVAEGRKLSVEYIDSIAQGRVWIGPDALRNGLVDRIGGLSEAIRIAKEKAGIKGDRDIRFVQYPGMPLFNLNFLQPKLFGLENRENEFLEFMKFRIEHNGEPMPVLPLEDWGMNK